LESHEEFRVMKSKKPVYTLVVFSLKAETGDDLLFDIGAPAIDISLAVFIKASIMPAGYS
jgi:hypothetical protein